MIPRPALLWLFALALIATPLLAALARRLGWTDRRPPEEAERKPRLSRVPPIGGTLLLGGLLLYAALRPGELELPWWALLAAYGLGLIDDLRGLAPRAKLLGQLAVGLLLAREVGAHGVHSWYWCGAAVVACNAANTFDHADGILVGSSLLFLPSIPAAEALLAAFLPSNLLWRRGPERVPLAYLGDSGSHLLGILLLLSPAGLFALALPLLDLARVSRLRLRAGRRPWQGDRRHLAHRLETGRSALVVAVWIALVAAPGALVGLVSAEPPRALSALRWTGVALTALLFWLTLRATSDPSSQQES